MLSKIPQSETLADQAYRAIKRAIIQNKFLPGDLLPEETMASMLGISRTPLRKALHRLAYEGLVEMETGRAARVAVISEKDMEDFLKLRELLEVFSAEQAVTHVTDTFIKQLKEMMKEQRESIDNKDLYRFIEIDSSFHVSIASVTNNQKLREFVENLNNHLHRYLILTGTLEESADQAYQEHLEIIQALQERNAGKAGAAMKEHIRNVEIRGKKLKGVTL